MFYHIAINEAAEEIERLPEYLPQYNNSIALSVDVRTLKRATEGTMHCSFTYNQVHFCILYIFKHNASSSRSISLDGRKC